MNIRRALITGIYGQDGSYLAELLSAKGYDVCGIEKQPLSDNARVICAYLKEKGITPFTIHNCDLNSYNEVCSLIAKVKPDELYHLAATHYSSAVIDVDRGHADRELFHNNVLSSLNIICSISEVSRHTKLVMAGSCLMFDESGNSLQNECTKYAASSMYGLSKITAFNILNYYREKFNLHLSTAILYNHESPRRQETFISKTIVSNLVKVKRNEIKHFSVGGLTAIRDWGYAKDYAYGMWLMTQQEKPKDYILATGRAHTVNDIIISAAKQLGISAEDVVTQDKGLIRKPKDTILIGDPRLAREDLKWECSVDFEGLIEILVRNELNGTLD